MREKNLHNELDRIADMMKEARLSADKYKTLYM